MSLRDKKGRFIKGYKHTKKQKNKIRKARIELLRDNPEKHNWYKDGKGSTSDRYIKNGYLNTGKYKHYSHQGFQKGHEYYKNILNNYTKNKAETRLEDNLPDEYEYVGDGKMFINRKCPDFIFKKQKKIIELFGDYWHSKKITGISETIHEKERIEHFAKYGYETLIIWEKELSNMTKLKNKILNYTYGI